MYNIYNRVRIYLLVLLFYFFTFILWTKIEMTPKVGPKPRLAVLWPTSWDPFQVCPEPGWLRGTTSGPACCRAGRKPTAGLRTGPGGPGQGMALSAGPPWPPGGVCRWRRRGELVSAAAASAMLLLIVCFFCRGRWASQRRLGKVSRCAFAVLRCSLKGVLFKPASLHCLHEHDLPPPPPGDCHTCLGQPTAARGTGVQKKRMKVVVLGLHQLTCGAGKPIARPYSEAVVKACTRRFIRWQHSGRGGYGMP